ncbi:MAG: SHOCT domain-containing protein [Spirochaetaceae bacterium]|nr:SHOCT domain-containing protein [Spirochaetaceae bacterium]
MAQVQAASQAEFDSVVVLKRYKKLLDEGVITQEDFDAKKKEILKI